MTVQAPQGAEELTMGMCYCPPLAAGWMGMLSSTALLSLLVLPGVPMLQFLIMGQIQSLEIKPLTEQKGFNPEIAAMVLLQRKKKGSNNSYSKWFMSFPIKHLCKRALSQL